MTELALRYSPKRRVISPAMIATLMARLRLRRPSTMGMVRRASAASWTLGGTPALSLPNSTTSWAVIVWSPPSV